MVLTGFLIALTARIKHFTSKGWSLETFFAQILFMEGDLNSYWQDAAV